MVLNPGYLLKKFLLYEIMRITIWKIVQDTKILGEQKGPCFWAKAIKNPNQTFIRRSVSSAGSA